MATIKALKIPYCKRYYERLLCHADCKRYYERPFVIRNVLQILRGPANLLVWEVYAQRGLRVLQTPWTLTVANRSVHNGDSRPFTGVSRSYVRAELRLRMDINSTVITGVDSQASGTP